MAFGQLPVPVDPNELLLSQPMPGASALQQPAAPPPPQLSPMQVGGTTVFANPVTGEVSAPPVTSTTEKNPTWATTKAPETAKIQAAEASSAETRTMAEEAAKQLASAKVQEETFRAEQTTRENELLKQQMAEREASLKDQDARVSAELTNLRARQAEQASMKPTTYVEDMGTFRHALASIGVALGAYAATRSGGPNTAFEIFKAGEQSHREKQRALVDQNAAQIEQATGNVRAANEMRTRAMAAIDEKYLLKNKFLQNMIEAKIKAIPTAAASGQAELAKLRKDYDATEMDVAQKLAGTRTDQGPEKSTTTVEGKAQPGTTNPSPQFDKTLAIYGDAMDSAIKEMDSLPRPTQKELETAQNNESLLEAASEQNKTYGGAARTIVGRKLGVVPRTRGEGLSDTAQAYLNAMDRANEGFQRVVSGANLQEKERTRLMNQLTILPGDSEKVVQAKLAGMRRERDNFLALSGKAAQQLPSQKSVPSPAPGGQTPAQKAYTAKTEKQIAQDKRDFAQERKTLGEATRLLSKKDLPDNARRALEAIKKNPGDPRARSVLDKIGGM